MAKKQKTINKSQKSNNLAKALLVMLGLVLVFMICAQLVFNFVVWKYIKSSRQSILQTYQKAP